jgi:putative endonuclease
MKKQSRELGKEGEAMARQHLESKGYTFIEQNYRYKRGEIDLIMQKEGTLVFVEVKRRSGSAFGYPEEMVSESQAAKLLETAEAYLEACGHQGPIRFDIVAILGKQIRHFEDAIA